MQLEKVLVILAVSGWALGGTAAKAQDLIAHWTFDEGSGAMARATPAA